MILLVEKMEWWEVLIIVFNLKVIFWLWSHAHLLVILAASNLASPFCLAMSVASSSKVSYIGKRAKSPSPGRQGAGACERCRRSRGTPNPIKCAKYDDDVLPFRGGICVPCSNFSQKVWRSRPKSELTEALKDGANLDLYLEQLNEYEEDYKCAESKNGRISKAKNYSLPFKTVSAVEENKITFEKDLGVLWPEKLYKLKKQVSAIPKELLTSVIDEGGQVVKGVVLPGEEGSLPGCIKMKREWSRGVRKDHELSNSLKQDSSEHIDADFAYGASKLGKHEAEDVKTEDAHGYVLKNYAKASATDSLDTGDDDIDYLSGLIVPSASPPAKKACPPAKKARVGEQVPKDPSGADGATPTKARGKEAVRSKLGLKQFQEIGASQTILADTKRTFTQAASSQGIISMQEKAVQTMIDKVEKRLVAKVVSVVTRAADDFCLRGENGENITGDTLHADGMAVTRELQNAILKLQALKELITALNGNEIHACASAHMTCACVGLTVPSALNQTWTLLSVKRALTAGEIGQATKWLTLDNASGEDSTTKPLPYSIQAIQDLADRTDAQHKIMQDVLWWIANDAPTDICVIAKAWADVATGELSSGLRHLSKYDGSDVTNSETDLKDAHAYFSGGAPAKSPLLKIMCTAAGQALTRSVSGAIVLMESDRAFAARLPDLTRRAEALIEISFSGVSKEELQVAAARARAIAADLADFRANSSERFKATHADTFRRTESHLVGHARACDGIVCRDFWKECTSVLTSVRVNDGATDAQVSAWLKTLKTAVKIVETNRSEHGSWVPEETRTSLQAQTELWSKMVHVTTKGLPALTSINPEISDSNIVALAEFFQDAPVTMCCSEEFQGMGAGHQLCQWFGPQPFKDCGAAVAAVAAFKRVIGDLAKSQLKEHMAGIDGLVSVLPYVLGGKALTDWKLKDAQAFVATDPVVLANSVAFLERVSKSYSACITHAGGSALVDIPTANKGQASESLVSHECHHLHVVAATLANAVIFSNGYHVMAEKPENMLDTKGFSKVMAMVDAWCGFRTESKRLSQFGNTSLCVKATSTLQDAEIPAWKDLWSWLLQRMDIDLKAAVIVPLPTPEYKSIWLALDECGDVSDEGQESLMKLTQDKFSKVCYKLWNGKLKGMDSQFIRMAEKVGASRADIESLKAFWEETTLNLRRTVASNFMVSALFASLPQDGESRKGIVDRCRKRIEPLSVAEHPRLQLMADQLTKG